MKTESLDDFLSAHEDRAGAPDAGALAAVVRALAVAAVRVGAAIRLGPLGEAGDGAASARSGANGGGEGSDADGSGADAAARNAGGDLQKALDVFADVAFLDALRAAPVSCFASEEQDDAVMLDPSAPFAVAIDPLDGSSNIDANVSIGTIFSVLPTPADDPGSAALQPGARQRAAGFFIYGPQLMLVLTLGAGTWRFIHSPIDDRFVRVGERLAIPAATGEFAINASNHRHWDDPVRLYIEDCLAGELGPREKNFNMRWVASLVAEAYRILVRGGVFLYPGDGRRGYAAGRLRLIYEANPVAFLVEQAGGSATNGRARILDIAPHDIHQRTPLVFGAVDEVERVGRYHEEPAALAERAPLFGNRGLFRA